MAKLDKRWADSNQSFMPVASVTVTTADQTTPDDDTFADNWETNSAGVLKVYNSTDAATYFYLAIKDTSEVYYVSLTPM